MNKEEKKKTRKRKIDNIEDSEPETKPRKKRSQAKPRKLPQQEPKQGEINDREITYSLWKFENDINDNKNNNWGVRGVNPPIEIKSDIIIICNIENDI